MHVAKTTSSCLKRVVARLHLNTKTSKNIICYHYAFEVFIPVKPRKHLKDDEALDCTDFKSNIQNQDRLNFRPKVRIDEK